MEKSRPFREVVIERIGNVITQSNIEEVTEDDIRKAIESHKNNNCDHSIMVDEYGPIYDSRSCYVCGKSFGFV